MKNIYIVLFSLIVIIIYANAYSQDCYTVIKVKGTVYNSSKGKDVKVSDELCSANELIFKSSNSAVVVHSTVKGRFTLKPQKSEDKKTEFACIMGDILKQSSSGNLSSRGVLSLREEFKDDYYIIGSLMIKVEEKDFPMNENTFFYLSYIYISDSVNKKLPYKADSLIMEKKEIYTYKESDINSDDIENVTLYYYDKVKKVSLKISAFRLTFLNEDEIYAEIKSYRDLIDSGSRSRKEIYEEILSYIYDTYGNFNIEYFEQWYNRKFY